METSAPPPLPGSLDIASKHRRLPSFLHSLPEIDSRLGTNFRKTSDVMSSRKPGGSGDNLKMLHDNLKMLHAGTRSAPPWPAQVLRNSTSKEGWPWAVSGQMRWLGKYVSNDTSSVCLSLGCHGLQDHRFSAGLPKIRDYRAMQNIRKKRSHTTRPPRAERGFDSVFFPVAPFLRGH